MGFKILGIPEMDTTWELIHRKIMVNVVDPRQITKVDSPHWLTGLYRPIKIKHSYSKSGYFTELQVIKETGVLL
jgi:hypothetical protein